MKDKEYVEYRGIHLNKRLYRSMIKDYKNGTRFYRRPFVRKLSEEYFDFEMIKIRDALIDNIEFFSLYKNPYEIWLDECDIARIDRSRSLDCVESLFIWSSSGGNLYADVSCYN